ncbi:MAG: hypothetical protein MR544_12330 [Parabacteroides sp.]|nr:hypothetical protein [Parabacteroides sp.]
MKKKVYEKPMLISEAFISNEYVAACENSSSYVGYCDISGDVYLDTNGNGIFDPGGDNGDSVWREYTNRACGEKYESTIKPKINAFVVHGFRWDFSSKHWVWDKATPVFNYRNVHVTQNIDETLHHNVS